MRNRPTHQQTNEQTRKDITTNRTYFVNQFISARQVP